MQLLRGRRLRRASASDQTGRVHKGTFYFTRNYWEDKYIDSRRCRDEILLFYDNDSLGARNAIRSSVGEAATTVWKDAGSSPAFKNRGGTAAWYLI